jgi:UDP-N-acetylmuramoyl-L-alanyl-D-glutamate--2,6-diaminopimelate ligase
MIKTITITERRDAIEAACKLAAPHDVILIAGKGHENYQEVNGVKHHFDDVEELTNAFKNI